MATSPKKNPEVEARGWRWHTREAEPGRWVARAWSVRNPRRVTERAAADELSALDALRLALVTRPALARGLDPAAAVLANEYGHRIYPGGRF